MAAAILIRDDTLEALQALVQMANDEQEDAEVALSDAIDGLLAVTRESSIEDELLREVIHIARKN